MKKHDQPIVDGTQRLANVNAFYSSILSVDTSVDNSDVIGNSNADDDLVHVVLSGQFIDRVRLFSQGNAGLLDPKNCVYLIDSFGDDKNLQQADGWAP